MPRLRPRRPDVGCDLLVVCTANLCRSPYVAALLRSARPDLDVRSAGVVPVSVEGPNPMLAPLLAERGVTEPVELPSRLTAPRVRGARLIVAAAHEHRLAAIHLDRTAVARAATLKELARWIAADAPHGLDAVVTTVARAAERPDAERDDDLADPFGLGPDDYLAMARTVDPLVAVLVDALGTDG